MGLPVHEFDLERARRFRPDEGFVKTAVLVEPADDDALTLRTPFGDETVRGAFYAVAEGDGSYAATRERFEQSHRRVGPNQWVKDSEVLAYRADVPCRVVTEIDGETESEVVARAGDWIVRQAAGEVMVVAPTDFQARYRPIDESPAPAAAETGG